MRVNHPTESQKTIPSRLRTNPATTIAAESVPRTVGSVDVVCRALPRAPILGPVPASGPAAADGDEPGSIIASRISDSWIERGVDHVDEEVDQDVAHRHYDDEPLDHRVVAGVDRVHGQ